MSLLSAQEQHVRTMRNLRRLIADRGFNPVCRFFLREGMVLQEYDAQNVHDDRKLWVLLRARINVHNVRSLVACLTPDAHNDDVGQSQAQRQAQSQAQSEGDKIHRPSHVTVLLVAPDRLTAHARAMVRSSDHERFCMEGWNMSELQRRVPDHIGYRPHRLLTDAEVDKLVAARPARIKVKDLPCILTTDIVARYFGWRRVGSVIEVQYESAHSGKVFEYRQLAHDDAEFVE